MEPEQLATMLAGAKKPRRVMPGLSSGGLSTGARLSLACQKCRGPVITGRLDSTGLVNRGGAPVPTQCSFKWAAEISDEHLMLGTLREWKALAGARAFWLAKALYLGTERNGITLVIPVAWRRISASA